MKQFLSTLAVSLIAGSISISAFAFDAAKPVVAAAKDKVPTTSVAKPTEAKKETGIKASLKKLLPQAKDAAAK